LARCVYGSKWYFLLVVQFHPSVVLLSLLLRLAHYVLFVPTTLPNRATTLFSRTFRSHCLIIIRRSPLILRGTLLLRTPFYSVLFPSRSMPLLFTLSSVYVPSLFSQLPKPLFWLIPLQVSVYPTPSPTDVRLTCFSRSCTVHLPLTFYSFHITLSHLQG